VEPDNLPQFPRVEIADLFHIAKNPDEISWEPFKHGVDIHRLYGDGITGPSAALIRFHREGRVPVHVHTGYEHILTLTGSQRDQDCTTKAGTLVINPPGTQHSVIGEEGCIVLAIYEKPVRFLAETVKRTAMITDTVVSE
jgi:anti-sigma factor ChrR (cupin superfamily)